MGRTIYYKPLTRKQWAEVLEQAKNKPPVPDAKLVERKFGQGLRPAWVFRADGAHRRYEAWFASSDPTPIVGMSFDDGSFTGTIPFKAKPNLMIVER